MRQILSYFLVLTLVFSGCASRNNSSSIESNPISTLAQEREMGERIHQQIMASFYVYTEPDVVSYVGKVGKKITPYAKRQELAYQFIVLYNEKIYATSAPGGYVYVTTGMLNFLENEAELAAVLSHEIGRLQNSDIRLTATSKVVDAVAQVTAIVGPLLGPIGALATVGTSLVHLAVFSSNKTPDKQMEEADLLALNMMSEAGYDPQSFIDMIYKFLEADQGMAPYFYDYYQARPITQKRFEVIEAEFNALPLMNRTFTTNTQAYQDMTKGIRQMYQV